MMSCAERGKKKKLTKFSCVYRDRKHFKQGMRRGSNWPSSTLYSDKKQKITK